MSPRKHGPKADIVLPDALTEATLEGWLQAADTRMKEALESKSTPAPILVQIYDRLQARKKLLQGDGTPTVTLTRLSARMCVELAKGLPWSTVTGGKLGLVARQWIRKMLTGASKPTPNGRAPE